ncbi:peptidylprolyl isomerase [Candidatus Woesearchaeota archaeon]|nr:peptidylprolyl isomerase [Candidatus Woesearchaeota archaeon]
MTTAQQGMKVKIHYTGKLDNGDVFDSSEGKEPLEFVIGEGKIIKGFEAGVVGMNVGEEKDLTIPPEKGYGQPRKELVQQVPKEKLGDVKPEVGMMIGMQLPGVEQTFPAKITEVKEDGGVTVDLNPPLAGKTLHFHVKLESAEPAAKDAEQQAPPAGEAPDKQA